MSLRRWLPIALYLVLAFASLYPLSVRPHNTVPHIGDPLENAYLIAWNAHQVPRAPASLYDLNVFYPTPNALTFTDHRFLPAWLAMPVVWLTGNSVLAYNVAVFMACFLAACAARALGLFLGLESVGAWTVGALYAFHTYQLNEIPRLQIISHGLLPLVIRETLVFLKTPTRSAAWRTAALMLLLGLCANYWLLYGCLVLAMILGIGLLVRPRVTWTGLRYLLIPTLAAIALYLPIMIPYLVSARTHSFHHGLPAGIDLQHYLSTLPSNILYGPLFPDIVPRLRPHFVGFASLGLALAAAPLLWFTTRNKTIPDEKSESGTLPPRLWLPCSAMLTVVFVLLSLGKDLCFFGECLAPGPYRLLYAWLPGFQMVRFPERLGLIAMLFLALLVGFSLTVLRRSGWVVPSILLAAFVPIEHLSPAARGVTRIPVGDEVPEVYRWLAKTPVRGLAEVPIHGEMLIRKETLEMYFSSFHFKPIVHGYATFPPAESLRIRRLVLAFPREEALEQLQAIGVDTLIVHFPPRDKLHFHAREVLRRPGFYRRIRRLEGLGKIRKIASFEGPTARIPNGIDVVYRF